MKYLKTYEENAELQIGNFVLCKEVSAIKDLQNFISENIGQYIRKQHQKNNIYYIIEYENVPKNLKSYFTMKEYNKTQYNCRQMSKRELVHWSKNKEDLEAILTANKSGKSKETKKYY